MKANELRIGNWVKIPELDMTDSVGAPVPEKLPEQIVQVEAIGYYQKNEGLYMYFDGGDIALIGDEYGPQPITLTEEWLVKWGFVYDAELRGHVISHLRMGFLIKGNDLYLESDVACGWEYISKYNDLNHVHTLQNLYFALTAEELTIKL